MSQCRLIVASLGTYYYNNLLSEINIYNHRIIVVYQYRSWYVISKNIQQLLL